MTTRMPSILRKTFRLPSPLVRPGSRVFQLGLWLGAACLISSCLGPKPNPTALDFEDLPKSWKHGATTTEPPNEKQLAKWWTRFQDPILSELISTSLENSPDIATAISRIREARSRRQLAISQLYPTLSNNSSSRIDQTWTEVKSTDLQGRTQTHTVIQASPGYSSGLSLSWELDVFGKQQLAIRASEADLERSKWDFHGVQASLAAEVASSYIDLRAAQERLHFTKENLKSREETHQFALWREKAGETTALETQQSLTSLEQTRASLPALERSIEEASNRLALLTGKPPGSYDSKLQKSRPLPPLPPQLAVSIPAQTLENRPDVRASAQSLSAAMSRTKAAGRERLPSITLNGNLGLSAITPAGIFDHERVTAGLSGGLGAPIFDAGRIRETFKIQTESEEQSFQSYRKTVLTALTEVENALIATRRIAERIVLLEKALASAESAHEMVNQRYSTGLIDILNVLEAQRTLLSTQEQLTSARSDLINAHIQLYRAMGGGWENTESTSSR